MKTTIGQLLINESLPKDLRDYSRVINKKNIKPLFQELAERYPGKYKEVTANLMKIGEDVSYEDGSSVTLADLKSASIKKKLIPVLQARVQEIAENDKLSQEQKDDLIVKESAKVLGKLGEAVLREGVDTGNRLSEFAASGSRGGASAVNQLRGAGLLVADHKNRPIPVPILHNFSEGVDPVELWAASYGVRKGYVDIKSATPKAGYFSKQLGYATHKLVTSDDKPIQGTGLPVDTDDPDNEGTVLAENYGRYKRGTVLTPKIIKELRRNNKRILVHSPIASVSTGTGIPRAAVGIMESGDIPAAGTNVGIPAAQSVGEPLAQSAISSKHIAGAVGHSGGGASAATQQGFDLVNVLANIPKHYQGKSAVADVDGTVSRVEKAPQGGSYIYVGDHKAYVPPGLDVTVKPGTRIEAGDVLSTGIPSPAEIVAHKGIGEGRRVFAQNFHKTLQESGVNVNRRISEILTRGLINHIRLTTSNSRGGLPDDIVEYDDFAAKYSPRDGAKAYRTKMAKGKYLEQPILHYSIGTRITPRVIKELNEFGVKNVMAHDSEPEFMPEMQRALDSMSVDKDWMVRLGGFGLKKNMLDAVHRGAESERHSQSYMPALAQGVNFGMKDGKPY